MEERLPVRKNGRLKGYDYSQPGTYFITICTKVRRENILCWIDPPVGAAVPGGPCPVILTPAGEIVRRAVEKINTAYANAEIDTCGIMPDHIHLILVLRRTPCPDGEIFPGGEAVPGSQAGNRDGPPGAAAPTGEIPKIVNALKGLSSREIGESIWQRGYYDRIIRSGAELAAVRRYILENPQRWWEKRGDFL